MKYQPKGSMCLACKNYSKDCSDLKFEKMPVFVKDKDVAIVICTEYRRIDDDTDMV